MGESTEKWNQRIAKLGESRARNHHRNVSLRYYADPALGQWADCRRSGIANCELEPENVFFQRARVSSDCILTSVTSIPATERLLNHA